MIKNFENYRLKEEFAGGIAQWMKNGQAVLLVKTSGLTREAVREAFRAQERGEDIYIFNYKRYMNL